MLIFIILLIFSSMLCSIYALYNYHTLNQITYEMVNGEVDVNDTEFEFEEI